MVSVPVHQLQFQLLIVSSQGTRPPSTEFIPPTMQIQTALIHEPRKPASIPTQAREQVHDGMWHLCAREAVGHAEATFVFLHMRVQLRLKVCRVCQAKRRSAALIRPGKVASALLGGDSSLYRSTIAVRRQ